MSNAQLKTDQMWIDCGGCSEVILVQGRGGGVSPHEGSQSVIYDGDALTCRNCDTEHEIEISVTKHE